MLPSPVRVVSSESIYVWISTGSGRRNDTLHLKIMGNYQSRKNMFIIALALAHLDLSSVTIHS